VRAARVRRGCHPQRHGSKRSLLPSHPDDLNPSTHLAMKFWQGPSPAEATAAFLLLATPAMSMLKCEDMVADDHKFNLKPLGGPHSVTVSRAAAGNYHNTTYTVDLCASLKWNDAAPKEHQCPQDSRGTPSLSISCYSLSVIPQVFTCRMTPNLRVSL
jgi:hypothetical protein